MYNGAQSLVTLSVEAIAELVEDHAPESGTLDFKETLILDKMETKRDLVRDVSAFANASGGWIIVGISEEDMLHRAAGWAHLSTTDAEKIRKQVLDLYSSHIDPAIPGFDVQTGLVPDKTSLVVISIPAGQVPHAVTGFKDTTECYIRIDDRKRQMTRAELQAAFARASSWRDTPEPRDGFPNGRSAIEEALQKVQETIVNQPFFFIAGAPVTLHAGTLDLQSQELQQILFKNPDENRLRTILSENVRKAKMTSRDISVSTGSHTFSLHDDGLMIWTVRVSDGAGFFQLEKEDRKRVFNQYAIIEYPLSFVRSFCALRGIMKGTSGPYVMQMAYSGCQDITLYPGHVGLEGYSSTSVSWDVDKGRTREQLIRALYEPKKFNPIVPADQITHDLVRDFYQAFGYSQEAIPSFWDDTAKVFDLDPKQRRQP